MLLITGALHLYWAQYIKSNHQKVQNLRRQERIFMYSAVIFYTSLHLTIKRRSQVRLTISLIPESAEWQFELFSFHEILFWSSPPNTTAHTFKPFSHFYNITCGVLYKLAHRNYNSRLQCVCYEKSFQEASKTSYYSIQSDVVWIEEISTLGNRLIANWSRLFHRKDLDIVVVAI